MQGVKHRIATIQKGNIKAEIALDCGGRIAQILYKNKNLLMGDMKTWRINPPLPTPQTTDFIQYFGAETWIGPQSEWWLNQDLNIEQRESPIKWPPDPFVSYGRFKVLSQTQESITITSEPSPLTGLKMTKVYEITSDGKVLMTTHVTNTAEQPKKFDIWHIVRTPVSAVPSFVTDKASYKVEGPTHDYERMVIHKLEENELYDNLFNFHFDTEAMQADAQKRIDEKETTPVYTAKAFCSYANNGLYTVFSERDDVFMVLHTDEFPAKDLEEGAAPIEVYCYYNAIENKGFYEIEFHSPTLTLKPNEIKHFTTVIEVNP